MEQDIYRSNNPIGSDTDNTVAVTNINLQVPDSIMKEEDHNENYREMYRKQMYEKYKAKGCRIMALNFVTGALTLSFLLAMIIVAAKRSKNQIPELQNQPKISDYEQLFSMYMEFFDKDYSDKVVKQVRYEMFCSNMLYFDAMTTMYDIDFGGDRINMFSDTSFEEFQQMLGSHPDYQTAKQQKINNTQALPKTVDWTSYLSPVSFQGTNCASAYMIASLKAIEAHYAINKKQSVQQLSVQQVLNCMYSTTSFGCQGGLVTDVFNYAINNSLPSESANPYQGFRSTCYTNLTKGKTPLIKGYVQVPAYDNEQLKAALQKGPVVALIDAGMLQFYESGIVEESWCPIKERIYPNHAVLVVGYENDHFVVQNSWGTGWGEKGYFKVRMVNSNSDNTNKGVCGILTDLKYPIIA